MATEKDNEKEQSFYSYRSVAKCLSAGISFLTDHFLHLVKLSLPVAIPLALVLAASIYVSCDVQLLANPVNLLMTEGVLAFLLVLLTAAFVGFVFNMVRMKSEDLDLRTVRLKDAYRKPFFKLTVNAFVVSVIYMVVMCGFGWLMMKSMMREAHDMSEVVENVVVTIVLLLIMIVLFVPTGFCLPNVELGEGSLMKKFWKGYKVGWKKWAKLFALTLVVGIVVGVIAILLMSPAIVISLMQRNASLSMLEGDAVKLPNLFPVWEVVVLLVSTFLLTVLSWIQYLPLAYLYASVKGDMEESRDGLPMI